MTEQGNEILARLDKKMTKMETALLGYNGDHGQPGLCSQFDRLVKDYYKFKRQCCIIFGILIGSGVLGVMVDKVLL